MLRVNHVSFAYDNVSILEDINLSVEKGKHMAIIGESGCGKSTLLKIIFGLLHINDGEIYWGENQIMGPLHNLVPGERYMKYLSQDLELMPFITVEENVSEFLSVFEPEKLKERTLEVLETIEMTNFAKTKVKNLSGGQQQRVALARALAQQPEILLLDEPFSHIDNSRKNNLRRNVFAYLKKQGVTVITATHDHNDMLPFADTMAVLKNKGIIAEGTPKKLYRQPNDLYVATLFGEANKIPINIVKSYADTKRRIIVYAHEFRVSGKSGLEVIVKESYFMGGYFMIEGTYGEEKIYFHHHTSLEKNKEVFLNVSIETINQRLTG